MVVGETKAWEFICPNAIGSIDEDCRGKKCMAWRWVMFEDFPHLRDDTDENYGYCGIAGEPSVVNIDNDYFSDKENKKK